MKLNIFIPIFLVAVTVSVHANAIYYNLASGVPLTQDWSNAGLITADDDWSGVPSMQGFRGDNLTAGTGTDPQTILADEGTPDVNANQTNPNTFTTGGVAEFAIANPTIALQGSGTADAPFLAIYLNTINVHTIHLTFNLRDIDGSTDNAIQQIALQYRIGNSGDFANITGGYIADATTGPSLATLLTPVSVFLPTDAENYAEIQVRILTSNAVGNDEWVGIDDISITANVPDTLPFAFAAVTFLAVLGLGYRVRRQQFNA